MNTDTIRKNTDIIIWSLVNSGRVNLAASCFECSEPDCVEIHRQIECDSRFTKGRPYEYGSEIIIYQGNGKFYSTMTNKPVFPNYQFLGFIIPKGV